MNKKRPDWGLLFKIRAVGYSTYYVTMLHSDEPISPDFVHRSYAVRWILQNYDNLAIEKVLLK